MDAAKNARFGMTTKVSAKRREARAVVLPLAAVTADPEG
jgi:hypothetical protein